MDVRRAPTHVQHRVEVTGPDGRRMTIEVIANERHTGSVRVRWDPTGASPPRFVTEWPVGRYVVVALVVVAAIAAGWFFFG